ncbi:hypothetical protein ISF_07420 [Cordyceps fumosorosea ARSEF 2679]|uniref:Rhodopsin domain-containing protein n=1 Tax=Cordyceps fumosorosea (strain ARSEF 2679) TaxID=1081104 RepID=A0A167PPY8_CORFA|nr:hypothetical protein ISF_07420 [Cordyceps fumosorosea ARSEF 2679]OAA56904.1 hypothetical protein ISF_07420 [Cordyceps fumosorosea ARSEF 2679]
MASSASLTIASSTSSTMASSFRRQSVEQLPAFAVIAPDDKRGALWIAVLLSLIFVAMTLGARLYVRKHMLGRDDFAVLAAVVLAVAQYAALFAGMPSGLGTSKRSVTAGNEHKNGSLLLASQAIFICGLFMAKLAVLLATERLLAATMRTVRRICVVIRAAIIAAAFASILLIIVSCPTRGLLPSSSANTTAPHRHHPRRCAGLGQRWLIIAILDGITELAVLCVFYGLVWSLQMRTTRKWVLTVLLGLRILCPVFTSIYTISIKAYASSTDPQVGVTSPLVWQQVALGYSLIAALLIALVPFLRSFHTGMVMNVQNMSGSGSHNNSAAGGGGGGGGAWGSSARSRDNVYRLRNLSKNAGTGTGTGVTLSGGDTSTSSNKDTGSSKDDMPRGVVPLSETEVTRSANRSDDGQSGSSVDGQQQQEPMVIQKTVDWSVRYEEGAAGGLQHPGLPGYLSNSSDPAAHR